jgi:hypothetical protein
VARVRRVGEWEIGRRHCVVGAFRGRRRTAWVEGIRKGMVAIVVVVKGRLEWRWRSFGIESVG